jgi:hypothetical protein
MGMGIGVKVKVSNFIGSPGHGISDGYNYRNCFRVHLIAKKAASIHFNLNFTDACRPWSRTGHFAPPRPHPAMNHRGRLF